MATKTLPQNKLCTSGARKDTGEEWIYASVYDPEFTPAVCAELDELLRLPKNWDGYGAPKIDQTIVAAAQKFVAELPESIAWRPHVVAMSPGNLQLEWQHGTKSLELEFESPTVIRYLQWHPEMNIEEEGTFRVTDSKFAVELILWLMAGTCV